MNDLDSDSTPEPTPEPPADGPNTEHLRDVRGLRRSTDSRVIAGVCAGVARHLNIDPVIVRIAVVALTFVGLAGLILYLAAWFLLPEDDAPSVAADWFGLDQNEEQVRVVGLFAALVLAIAAVVGDSGWEFWWIGWWILPVAFLYWLFVVRPRRRETDTAEFAASATAATTGTGEPSARDHIESYKAEQVALALARRRARQEQRRQSRSLLGLTVSLIAIGEAVALIADQAGASLPRTAYIAVALAGVALGCLLGAWWGRAGGLIPLGLVLSAVLVATSSLPPGNVGQQLQQPRSVSEVRSEYRHGLGQIQLDLSQVRQPTKLAGRTIHVKAGIGQTTVWVPDEVDVELTAHLGAGEIRAFGRTWHGRDNEVSVTDGDGKTLQLVIDQRLGDVEVSRR
jgi:phage shock protein PspC (stress-responsive transcriptional regulator)